MGAAGEIWVVRPSGRFEERTGEPFAVVARLSFRCSLQLRPEAHVCVCVFGAGSRSASKNKVGASRKWTEVMGSSREDLAQSMASESLLLC